MAGGHAPSPRLECPPGLRFLLLTQGLDHWPGQSDATPGSPPPKLELGRPGESSQEGQGVPHILFLKLSVIKVENIDLEQVPKYINKFCFASVLMG